MTVTDAPPRPTSPAPSGKPTRLTPPWDRRRIELLVSAVALAIGAVWAVRRVDISLSAFADGWDNMWRLWFGINRPTGMWPFQWDDLGGVIDSAVETFFMALLATAIAAVLSFPLGFLAARNTAPHPALRAVARGIIAAARTIPDLIFAAIFVRAFRIGPAAGVLAIGLHAIGMLGKLLADAIEETDHGQREGVSAAGAGWSQQLSTGVLPQVVPTYVGICLYRLDINFRSATVLGLVGAGGIGEYLRLYQGNLRWDLYMGVVVIIAITVLAVEWVSVTGRRLLLGHDRPGEVRRQTRLARLGEAVGVWRVSARDFRPAHTADEAAAPGAGPGAGPAATTAVAGPAADRAVADRVATARDLAREDAAKEDVNVPIAPEPSLQPPWTVERVKLAVFSAVVGVLVVASIWLSGVAWSDMFNGFRPRFGDPGPGELPTVWNVAIRMIPTDFDWWNETVRSATFETVAMGLAATALGLPFALLLGYLGARNVAPNRLVYGVTRVFQVLLRAIPEIIIAILLVAALGLGPFPGTIALAIGVVAVGAKFFSDALEVIDEGPREGVRATGASRIQEASSAVTPQFVPNLVANGLYLLDIMIRSSTILGIVGAGGIGFILFQSTRTLDWETVGGILFVVFVVVFVIERFSDWLRSRLI